ncbi:MAG: hypothetical protein GXY83_13905 [Rhodopirellula sp.]|nr:hypothetical protein [Rhodopirellula sp.]
MKLAEVSADKNAMNVLAGRFCQLASAGGQAADECFVLWRLAGELYESAGSLQQAEETRRRLAAEFGDIEESLQESLLPQLRLRPPGEDSQWRIANQLQQRYQVSQAGTPEEKQALAVRIFKDEHSPGDEEFVALRLALELFDEAERSEEVKTLGDQISMNYEVSIASLGERLLPRLVAARPAPADPLTGTLVDATKMIMNGDLKGGRVKLTEAGKTSGEDVRPDFLLGLLENFELSFIAAEECFRKCTKAKDQETARRAWNNLALVYLRQKKLKKTVDAFEKAMELGEPSEELVHNLGKLYALKATTTTSNFWDPATKRSLDKLCQKTNASAVFDATIGWQLMPLLAADGEPLGGVDRKLFEDPRCLFCNGLCRIPCPQCGGSGTVTQQRAQTMAVDPVSGRKLGRSVNVAAACPACRGSGVILCPFCDRGLEKGLARTAEQKPEESPGQPIAIPPGPGQAGTVPASQPGMSPTAQPGGQPSIQPGTQPFPQTPRR